MHGELQPVAAVDEAHVARVAVDEGVEVAGAGHHRIPGEFDQR